MKCPQCDSDLDVTDKVEVAVFCPVCLYVADLGRYIHMASGYQYNFRWLASNQYDVPEENGNGWLRVMPRNKGKLSFRLEVAQPSKSRALITQLRTIFAERFDGMTVWQEGVDGAFRGCPICEGNSFVRETEYVKSVVCAQNETHYKVELPLLVQSVVRTLGFSVAEVATDGSIFMVYYLEPPMSLKNLFGSLSNHLNPNRAKQSLIARVEVRFAKEKMVIAVEPFYLAGFEGKFEMIWQKLNQIELKKTSVIKIK